MEWKRGLKSIPLFFLVLLGTAAILIGAVALSGVMNGRSAVLPKVDVAVVGAEGDAMTEKGIRMAGRLEVVKATTKFHFVSEEQAEKGVEDGSYDAAIILNENMYDDINEGYNTPVHIRLSEDGTISEKLFKELVDVGVSDLGTAESAIYAFYDLSKEYPTVKRPGKTADKMAKRFIKLFLTRTAIWDDAMLSSDGEQNTSVYMIVTFLLSFSLLLGIGFAIFYSREERTTGKALERLGVSPVIQQGIKLSVMTFSIWLFMQIVTALLMIVPVCRDWSLWHPFASLLTAFGMAAYVHLVYSVARGPASAFIYLICTVAMVILAGGIVPIGQMPSAIAACMRILPFAGWHRYLSDLIGSGASAVSSGWWILVTALVLCGAAFYVGRLRDRGGAS